MSYRVSYSVYIVFFCFKQKTAYDMRISDWSSDVCSSDLAQRLQHVCVDEPCDDIVRQFAAVWEAEDVGAVDVVIVSIFSAGARYGDARQDVSEQKVSRIIVFVKKRNWRAAPLKCSDLSAGGFD